MGAFVIEFRSRSLAAGVVRPNWLMYRAHGPLLERMLNGSGALSWQIGYAGPQYRLKAERPNYALHDYTISHRSQLSEFDTSTGNEGGVPTDQQRAMLGYERQDVVWTVTQDGAGAIIDSGWHEFVNRVTWDRHGSWNPPLCQEAPNLQPCEQEGADPNNCCWHQELHSPREPYKWYDCDPREGDVGYPWCTPRIQAAEGDPQTTSWPRSWWRHNEFGVSCPDCEAHTPWSLSYPVGAVLVVLRQAGQEDLLFAAAEFGAPTWWRLGGYIAVRYVGRFFSR